jgi:diguanylate cyclase (GGDEF)-like protein
MRVTLLEYAHWSADLLKQIMLSLRPDAEIICLGHHDGEAFLMAQPAAAQARRILDEIRQRFAELHFIAGGSEFSVTLSAGIASTEQGASDAGELLERADRALYGAKHGGRNQVR